MKGAPTHTGRSQAGFTMVELLAAIAIMVALLGVSTIGVAVIQKSMTINRLDTYAKEIYVAAQNRLIAMESSGQLASFARDTAEQGHPLAYAPQDYDGSSDAWRRYYYAGCSEDIARQMVGNQTIATNGDWQGGYIIEFDPKTAVVYSVLYTEDPEFTSAGWTGGGPSVDAESFYEFVSSLSSRDKSERRSFTYPVGYYCGGASDSATPSTGMPTAFAPQARFVNGNELFLHITCDASTSLVASQNGLVVKVALSDGTHTQTLEFQGGSDFVLNEMGNIDIDVVLDSMREGMAFSDVAPALTPGANITATVDVSYTNGSDVVLTPVEKQPQATANSLYGALSGGQATIANLRHLANAGKAPEWVADFTQLADIDFASDGWWREESTTLSSATRDANLAAYGTEYANPLHPDEAAGSGLAPLAISHAFAYNAQGNKVSNLRISGSGASGLFAEIPEGAHVSNLVLVDPLVSGGSATGALAGVLAGTVEGCGVHLDIAGEEDLGKAGTLVVAASDAQAVGGLVGQAQGSASISNSYAAIDVANPQGSATGGLVGKASDSVRISNSYASGAVTSASLAGGLVGEANGAIAVSNCYATSRIYGDSAAGGLVGSITGGTLSADACRALGLVTTPAGGIPGSSGGFAGASAGSLAASNCSYIRQAGYNDALAAEHAGVTASSMADLFGSGLTADNSHPYRSDLLAKRFPFQPVLDEHWGNWPDKAGIKPTLAYFERYSDGTVGYYATTALAGDESGFSVQVDTLHKDLYVSEDGYALLCAWPLERFVASLNGAEPQELVRSVAPSDAAFTELAASGFAYRVAGQDLVAADVHAYRLPFGFQEVDRGAVVSFFDLLSLQIPNEDRTGTLMSFCYYNPHFACTAVNPEAGSSLAEAPEVPNVVQVRTARQLNALSRYSGYWSNTAGTMGETATFSQERGIDFGWYETPYCGHEMNLFDTARSNPLRNRPIGNEDAPFRFAYNGNDYAINDLLLDPDEGTTMFGKVEGGSVSEVALGSVYAPGAVREALAEEDE